MLSSATDLFISIRTELLRMFPRSGTVNKNLKGYCHLLRIRQNFAKRLGDFLKVVEISAVVGDLVDRSSPQPGVVGSWFN